MRIAICDDDEWELAHLSGLIAEYRLKRGINVDCRVFHNGTDFLCEMRGGEYDLVLLDILMPGISGLQAAQELRELDKDVKLVFISASPEFAMEGYSVEAYHYLLKPADAGSLFPLLDRVVGELPMQQEQGVLLKSRDGITRISFPRIEYVEVIDKTVFFHLSDSTVRDVTAAMGDFERQLLDRQEFIKPHRSYLVNMNYVQTIDTGCIVTASGCRIPVSRLRRSQVRDTYMDFLHRAETAASGHDVQSVKFSEKTEQFGEPWRILLVDDDPEERIFWGDILRSHGCIVRTAENGDDAVRLMASWRCDCVLLDVMLPDRDGFSLCEALHRISRTPVIFLSCVTETDRQLEGFAAGGIDYITKNTPAELFWAKVETRMKLAASGRTRYCHGSLLLDLAGRKVQVDGKELCLAPTEFDILLLLMKNAGRIFSPEEIFGMVWCGQPWDDGQMVQMHMSRLRRKLEKACGHHFIESVWGQGYRFVSEDA